MLDANLKQQLDTYLQNIVTPIEVSVSSDDSAKGRELEELGGEIIELSDKISRGSHNGQRSPSMAIAPGR